MSQLHQLIEQHWQQPKRWLSCLLKPFSLLFACVAAQRRRAAAKGRLKSERLPVPVVVVGNIHAGGTGKTPIVAALVSALQQRGVKVGIISRGYGRKSREVYVLNQHSSAADAGDEPLLLYRKTGAPTAVGSRRAEAGRALLAAYPDIELIVADDGLQHYALQRDIEIAVFPSADVGRSGLDVLPNGPLREPLQRLNSVDAIVISGGGSAQKLSAAAHFCSRIEAGEIYRLNNPQQKWHAGRLKMSEASFCAAKTESFAKMSEASFSEAKMSAANFSAAKTESFSPTNTNETNPAPTIAALAGIAKPQRFFDTLASLGITPAQTVILPDHAEIREQDLPQADRVLITEKDAVKLSGEAAENVWVLPVCAIIEPDLAAFVLGRLKMETKYPSESS
ncbi:tetraacyldisaccharide 4'-kinase [Neisseria sp. ZJ106]|uniref:Tetraacyldisaccharide 4'-kinase n=1 Tax=Neisseria lisongii TaxID=2912188 RepID=A0ABY7RMB6_9NEIS|nr:tetraacyldisaccharide 4'-kinase [Neisseria lisongii]MCF7521412.1 tetraacyldisaccharide 4'-kinase [Neisseria lisongii]WCL72397.1 tetraacyldisaccharide 4'-kinase [Neisseria lisongii]